MSGQQEAGAARAGPQLTAVLGALMVLLGGTVLLGWALRIAALTQVLPGYTSMVASTATGFMLCGLALLGLRTESGPRQNAASLAALAVLLLALANAVQLITEQPLGIDFPGLHAWVGDNNPHPGRMSEPTTAGFLLASLSLLLLRLRHRPYLNALGQSLGALVLLIGLIALAGYALRLEALYHWYAFNRMAVHTALGMCLLGTGLWQLWREREREFAAAREVMLVGGASLVAVAVLAGLVSAAWFRNASDAELNRTLEATRAARAGVVDTMIDLRSARASIVTTRALLLAQLRRLAAHPDDGPALALAREDIAALKSHGFSSIELRDGQGRLLVKDGASLGAGLPEFPVYSTEPGMTSLLWREGFVLRNRHEIIEHGSRIGSVLTEQPLPNLVRQLAPLSSGEAHDTVLLCGPRAGDGAIACFPDAPSAPVTAAPAAMIEFLRQALAGATATARFDSDAGHPQRIAYGPVADTGLALAIGVDEAALYAPVRGALSYGLLLVALIAVLGALLLRTRVRPLAERLAAAEGRYALVVRSLREGVMLFDAAGHVLAANDMAAQLLGGDTASLTNRSADEDWPVFHADGSPLTRAEYPVTRAAASNTAVLDQLMQLRAANGALRWIQVSALPTAQLPGRDERGVVVTFEDVTDRLEGEARAHAAEQRFRLMVDSIDDYAILMLDAQGHVATWNRGAERIEGYKADEIIGKHFSLFYPEEDRRAGRPAQKLQIAAETGRHVEEGWRLRKDGSRFWASAVISAVRDSRGALVGYAKVVHDLSERRDAEAAVAEAHRRVRSIIDSAPFSIITSDNNGIIDCVNPAAERLTYYSADELIGGTVQPIHVREEVVARAEELSQELGEHIEPGFATFTALSRRGITDARDWTYVRKDGSRVPVHLAVSALHDPQSRTITGYIGIAFDATERKRREEYTQHVAHHDALTGLPMRSLLNDRLTMAIARGQRGRRKVGVMMLDLDHFKRINDSLGHHVGDELLRTVARRLGDSVRATDTVARLGGDEFVVVLPDVHALAEVEHIASEIVRRLSAPASVAGHELHVTPSIGIALYPDTGQDPQELLRNADTAMYRAKAGGRRGYRVFTPEMQRLANDRLELENALRRALDRGELAVHYQPQICLETGRVIGMEALARWTDPQLGVISPVEFIPIAEESGLILRLGEWVLRTACRDARKLQQQTGLPLRLAVNLSSHQFAQDNLVEMIGESLRDGGLAAADLEIEITEGALMDTAPQTIDRLKAIRALGVGVAIDDFGTGFSSLAYVARFPVTALKIDRSFVAKIGNSPGDAAVAQAIIALACSLDIRVIAEGVETAAQLAFLRERCCDAAQGALLGHAVPSERFGVQGFHFGGARTAEDFAGHFTELAEASAARVREVAPV